MSRRDIQEIQSIVNQLCEPYGYQAVLAYVYSPEANDCSQVVVILEGPYHPEKLEKLSNQIHEKIPEVSKVTFSIAKDSG